MRRHLTLCVPLLGALACAGNSEEGTGIAAPVTVTSEPLCVMLGPQEEARAIYGTDLGITVPTPPGGDTTRQSILFGDTWASAADACAYPVAKADDLYATLPVERPATAGRPEALCDSLTYATGGEPGDPTFQRIRLFDNALSRTEDNQLDTGMLRTPVAVFQGGDRHFGLFVRAAHAECQLTSDCPSGMVCTADPTYALKPLGNCAPNIAIATDTAPMLCRDETDCPQDGVCGPASSGVCLLPNPYPSEKFGVAAPDWVAEDPRRGVAIGMRMASTAWADSLSDYASFTTFKTNRFVNATARTVAFFDPSQPENNDYSPGQHTLLMWGRASFATTGDFQALPFLLYHPIAELRDAQGNPRWQPRFFAGYGLDGRPTWSDREADAVPIYGAPNGSLSAKADVEMAEFDYVNQMSMTYLPQLGRWVMIYGGSVPAFAVANPQTGQAMPVRRPQPSPGGVHMRSAAHPFGASSADADPSEAFSAPRVLLDRMTMAAHLACDGGANSAADCTHSGDATDEQELNASISSARNRLTPDQWLEFSTMCTAGAAALDTQYSLGDDSGGHLYGVNVIESWTEVVDNDEGQAGLDLYWNVSTWNPYSVVLVRSRLRGGAL